MNPIQRFVRTNTRCSGEGRERERERWRECVGGISRDSLVDGLGSRVVDTRDTLQKRKRKENFSKRETREVSSEGGKEGRGKQT